MNETAEECLARILPVIEEKLLSWLPEEFGEPELLDAMRYSLTAGGKRVRPGLTLLVNELENGRQEDALPPACAVEYIHTYSLIHDDLPCMDDDDLRRGKATNHKVFGEALAVLAGDAFQSLAYETLARHARPDQTSAFVKELATAAGYLGMVGGQAGDMTATGKNISLEMMESIHLRKTGALLTSAIVMGAISSDTTTERVTLYREFGKQLGLLFQITDDLLDVTASAKNLGKTPGKDQAQQKAAYPLLLGLEKAKNRAVEAHDSAIDALKKLELEKSLLVEFTHYILVRVS